MKPSVLITVAIGAAAVLVVLPMVTSIDVFGLFLMTIFVVGSLFSAAIPDSLTLPPQSPGSPVFISSNNGESGQADGVAFDASGAAMTVWEEGIGLFSSSDQTHKVLARRYVEKSDSKSNEEGWSPSTEIVIPPKTEPVATNVVSFAPGHMLAFWTARDRRKDVPGGWPYGVWSASYSKGQWAAATPVSKAIPAAQISAGQKPTSVSTHHERLAVATGKDAASGKAIAVWQEWWCTGVCIENTSVKLSRIMSASYSAEGGWSTPIQVNNDSTPLPEEPEVSIDQQGRAIAVWMQFYDTTGTKALQKDEGLHIQRLHYSVLMPSSTTWTKPQLVTDVEPTADMSKAVITSNAAGDTVIAWAQKKGRKQSDTTENCEIAMATRLMTAERTKSEFAWETPKRLFETTGDIACSIVGLSLALDTAGNALVGWTAYTQPERDHVAYAPAGQPWRAQLALPYSSSGSTGQLRIAFVSPGRAVVIGTYTKHNQDRYSKRTYIVKHHFDADKMNAKTPSQAWSASERIDWPKGASAQQPTLAVHPNGQAISTWRQMIPGKEGISAYVWNTNNPK
jgi:hypothetical protein